MNENSTDIERYIERLLNGEMEEVERQEAMARIATDPVFKEEVRLQQKARLVTQEAEQQRVRNEISSIWEEINDNENPTKVLPLRRRQTVFITAAAILALLVLTLVLWPRQSPSEKTHAFIAGLGFESELTVFDRMGGVDNLDFYQARKLYEDGQYADAQQPFESLLTRYPQSDTIRFLLAQSYLKQGHLAEAKALFLQLTELDDKQSKIRQKAAWNLGLIYLKEENYINAKAQFSIVANSDRAAYQDLANQALQRIELLINTSP